MVSSYNVQGGKKRRRKKTKNRKSKRRTRKQMNKIRMKDPKYCCAGPGCPDYKHCINVLGDKYSGIRPKSKKTLKKMERCGKRYSEMGKNYVKCMKNKKFKKYIRSMKRIRKRIMGGSKKITIIEGHHPIDM